MAMKTYSIRLDDELISRLNGYSSAIYLMSGAPENLSNTVRFLLKNNKNLAHKPVKLAKLDQQYIDQLQDLVDKLEKSTQAYRDDENGVGNNINQIAKKFNTGIGTDSDKFELTNALADHRRAVSSLEDIATALTQIRKILCFEDIQDMVTNPTPTQVGDQNVGNSVGN